MPRSDITGVGHTCSMIDTVIENADAMAYLTAPGHIISKWEATEIKAAVKTINQLCEDIRDANSTLREVAIEQYNEAASWKQKANDAAAKVDELQQALNEAETENRALELELDQLASYAESLEQ